jgi:hypothetical protein
VGTGTLAYDLFVPVPTKPDKQQKTHAYVIPIQPLVDLKILNSCEMAKLSIIELTPERRKLSGSELKKISNTKKAYATGRHARRCWLSLAYVLTSNLDSP